MSPLTREQVDALKEKPSKTPLDPPRIPSVLGGGTICDGLWRLYSDDWPDGGANHWNDESGWAKAWDGYLSQGRFSFGEDVFGNQLLAIPGETNALLWNHENGDLFNLLVNPIELIETVFENGIDWIDFYEDGQLTIARQLLPIPLDMHLHWATPLIAGGTVDESNTALIARVSHLVGHAKLWSQVANLPTGSAIIPEQP